LVGVASGEPAVRVHLSAARKLGFEVVTTSPVVAQVWRNSRQAVLAKLLAATRVDAPDESAARRAGELLAKSRTRDVVLTLLLDSCGWGVPLLTSDPRDLGALHEAGRRAAHIVRV